MSMCSLGDIARECREICKDPTGLPVVGLEHLEPEDIELTRWDMPEETTFTKFFRKGQVLFGRRRSYLKKAAVAPCDGICSGDITVIEAIPGKVNPDLLPFIIQNDRFFTYANKGSAGSLSPRVKWAYLKDYPVNLPSLEEQARLAETFRALDKARRAYAHLIQTSDDLVKSQFVADNVYLYEKIA